MDGFHYMRRNPDVATIVWAKGAWGVGGAITLLLTIFGQRIYPLHGSPVLGMSIFYAARGVGTALGPILSRWVAHDRLRAMSRVMSASFFVAGFFYVGFGAVHSLPLAVSCVILAHFGGATIWVFSTVVLQKSVPNALQGRIFAAELALFTLTFSISTFFCGRLLDAAHADPFRLMRGLGWSFLAAGIAWTIAARAWPLREPAPELAAPTPPALEEIARAAD
jgi:hypothetical protein